MLASSGWTVDCVVLRGGARNPRGVAGPETRHPISGVLVGWRSTADPLDRTDITSDLAVLYDSTEFAWKPSDRVELPPNNQNGPSGTWQVDGTPQRWPAGTEVALRKA